MVVDVAITTFFKITIPLADDNAMLDHAPRKGTSMAVRMFALVVLPLIAVTVLATKRIEFEQQAAASASDLVDVVDLQQAVAAVLPPSQVEWITLTGLAEIDKLGVPREIVVDFTGFDVELMYQENMVDLERAFDHLAGSHGDLQLDGGATLGDQLSFIRGRLESQRTLSAQRRGTPEDVGAIFADLDALLSQLLVSNRSPSADTVTPDRHRARLAALGSVLFSAGELGHEVINGVLQGGDNPIDVARAAAVHDAYVAGFAALLDPDERVQFERVVIDMAADTQLLWAAGAEPGALAADPQLISRAAQTVVAQLDYVRALQEYSAGFHEATAADVRTRADEADASAFDARVLLWSSAILTLGLTVVVLWSILSPLRRLTRRAEAINGGELDLPALPIRGPADVRALTAVVNDMSASLGRVNEQIQRLASGEIDGMSELEELPGVIGVSLRRSVDHLAHVTSQLKHSEALSSEIVAQADDAIWTVDDDGAILSANEAGARLTGLDVDEQIGRQLGDLISQSSGEATVLTRTGIPPRIVVARSVIDVGDQRIAAVIAHDISERSQFAERLQYQAMHDALTGLPNRFAVLAHLEELASEHAGNIAVLYLDLDGFKSVNDAQGHAGGDRVLADVAGKLQRAVRNGEFVGRLGGDEFVVITHRFAQVADLMALGHRLIREVEIPVEHDGRLFALSACVGVAVPPEKSNALDMIGYADNAVYQAKSRGRGRVELFDIDMQTELDRRSDVELALRNAVVNDELVLHLQPVQDLRTGRFSRAEALIRWMRPGHGMVMPGDFIPVAEQSSIILDIERWVLLRACERLVEWRRRDPRCAHRLAVNISGLHLADGDLMADVEAVLAMTGADPNMLELELTESQFLHDLERATAVLQELRALGITIAVDDFGTGYSSMTYLRELPIDVVKIDGSFVARATDHGYDSTVIEAILSIGRILDLGVVAEGIETEDQLEYVKTRGCQWAQGFLLARPMPIEDAEALIFGPEPQQDDRSPVPVAASAWPVS